MMRARGAVAAAVLALAAITAACSDSGPGRTTANEPSVADQGRFEGLPVLPNASPIGPLSEMDGVITRSYEVKAGRTADDVFAFYDKVLPARGWKQAGPRKSMGRNAERVTWRSDKGRLEISTTIARDLPPNSPGGDRPHLQMSLLLRP